MRLNRRPGERSTTGGRPHRLVAIRYQIDTRTRPRYRSAMESGEFHLPETPLVFTDAAATKVSQLIDQEGNPELKLRVFISGGGCSGFQYGFTFEEALGDGDTRVENQGVTLLIDPMSVQYLMGAEIDYKEDLEGSRFVIRNPNAKTTCGCGSSFSV